MLTFAPVGSESPLVACSEKVVPSYLAGVLTLSVKITVSFPWYELNACLTFDTPIEDRKENTLLNPLVLYFHMV